MGVKAANEAENIHVASLLGQVANWGGAEEGKWKGSMYCVVCGAPESGDHLFLPCLS
jgi:hypothetical protein